MNYQEDPEWNMWVQNYTLHLAFRAAREHGSIDSSVSNPVLQKRKNQGGQHYIDSIQDNFRNNFTGFPNGKEIVHGYATSISSHTTSTSLVSLKTVYMNIYVASNTIILCFSKCVY